MKVSQHNVHDVWTNEDLLTDVLIARIEECGHYAPYNEEWQCLSTMIDYALKTELAKREGPTSRLIKKLSEIGYVPLDRIATVPSVKFGALTLSDDGTVGVNEQSIALSEPSSHKLRIYTSLDVYLTGRCYPIFSILLRGKSDPIFAISPDSKKLAVINGEQVTVWGLADCRILFRTTSNDEDGRKRNLLWSGNSEKIVITHDIGFRIIPIDGSEEGNITASIIGKNSNILTNDDASEFYYCENNVIFHASEDEGFARAVDDDDMDIGTCYLLHNKGGYWALIDGSAYLVKDNKLSYVKDVDPEVDTDPYRFEEIVADFMSQRLNDDTRYDKNTAIWIDGSDVVFGTALRGRNTHYCVISSEDLSYYKYVGKEQETGFISEHGDRLETIDEEYSFKITRPEKGEQSRFFLVRDDEQIPLGTCRFDAAAVIFDGKLFIHKGTTIEVYELNGYKLLLSTLAINADQWIICGTDGNGTVSLAKVEDVQSTLEEGSFARIRFGRMKAPSFTLDEFRDCSIEVNKVWNLKFSIAVKDNILFYFNRDGNRIKPVTLSRYNMKSGNMRRSSTIKCDESKFDVRMCELSGGRIAVVSLDDLDKNPSEDPRITVRIVDCNHVVDPETCDISKADNESGHLPVSGISDAFVLRDADNECVVVQFNSAKVPLICSRDADSRAQYPEKNGYVHGTVVAHDGETCIVRDMDGSYSRYDAKLNRLEDMPDYPEEPKKVKWPMNEIPLNREFRTSFGTILQNSGVFFFLKDTE